ncbi:MAG: BON domain-containing protein [Pirellulaceae bacterium]|nr:BON domain-containing protein [Pirellulaceae bacterium]
MIASEFNNLAQKISLVFVNHPHLQRRHVHFKMDGEDKVTLEGTVASFFEKQLAQEALRSIPAIERIENHLRVVSEPFT